MNKDETKKAIEVMQAYVDGKAIECKGAGERVWTTLTCQPPSWNWNLHEYRIKPEPMEIEVWVNQRGELPFTTRGYPELTGFTKKKFREVSEE